MRYQTLAKVCFGILTKKQANQSSALELATQNASSRFALRIWIGSSAHLNLYSGAANDFPCLVSVLIVHSMTRLSRIVRHRVGGRSATRCSSKASQKWLRSSLVADQWRSQPKVFGGPKCLALGEKQHFA